MLPSMDSYLYREIDKKLKQILDNRYIIEEVLKEVTKDSRDYFIQTFTGEGRREIPIVYTMPQEKAQYQGCIFINLKSGQENQSSIGLHEGFSPFEMGEVEKELVEVKKDEENSKLYFEVSEDIGRLTNVENLSFAESDERYIEGNRIYFNLEGNETLEGLEFNVNYTSSKGESFSIGKGFTSVEEYSVVPISTNMDTVRCLDLIIKAIFIMMRNNMEEQHGYALQRIRYNSIEPFNPESGNDVPELLYGRELSVSYTVSYNLDSPVLTEIDEINSNVSVRGK